MTLRGTFSFTAAAIAAQLLLILLQASVSTAAGPLPETGNSDPDMITETVQTPNQLAERPAREVIAAFEEASIVDGVPVVFVRKQALRDVGPNPGEVVLTRLPLGAGRSVTMELEPLRVLGPKTKIVLGALDGPDVPFSYDTSQVHLLRGKVQGYPNSGVVLFSSPRGIRGNIDLGPSEQRYMISSLDLTGQRLEPGLAMVYPVDKSAGSLPDVPLCGFQSTSAVAGCLQTEPPVSTIYNKRIRTVQIAVETDFDLYENFNDPTATMDYIVELFARTNAIFLAAIDTRFEVVFVRLFDNPAAEKSFMNNADPLSGYRSYWNTNPFEAGIARDTATFLSGRRNLPYGGVAYIAGVCTSFGYNVCGYLSGFPDPTRPYTGDYDTGVLAHELGHNFNTYHTPDYCPQIDRCYPPPTFPQRGTLMSYCSQTVSGGNLVEELWYHRRVRRVMRDFIQAGASCVSYDCNQNGIDDTVDIAGGTPDLNGNGIPDSCEDCNGNGILDPQEIASNPGLDLNGNGTPDGCEPDCQPNGIPDDLDIAQGTSTDLWGNGIPDECDPDCNGNSTPDYDEIQLDLTLDIDRNAVLDSCQNCDGDGINDLAELLGSRHAWVASDVLDYVGQFHPVSGVRVKKSTAGQVANAQDLIIAPGNRVLVTSATGNKVVAFDAVSGAYLSDFVPAGSGGLSYPTGLVIGHDGHLLVCSYNTNSVLKYNGATGAFIGAFVPAGSGGLFNPFGLTFGPNGNLFVTCGGTEVLEYDGTTGAFVRLFVRLADNGGLSGARGMVFKPDGNLLVASYNTDSIIQYDGSTGASLGKWNSGGTASALYLDGPWGLRLGLNGNVLATRDLPAAGEEGGHDHDDDVRDQDENIVALHVTSARIMEFDIRNGKYTRSFIVGDDTELRSTTGFAFMPSALSVDCNENLLQDNCDITSGFSADTNSNGVPDECAPPSIDWAPDPTAPTRVSRGLNFQVASPATATSFAKESAIKVTMIDLQHPNPRNLPQYAPPDFTTFDTSIHGLCAGAATGPNFNGHHCSTDAECLGPDDAVTTDDGACAIPGPGCTAIGETNPPTANGIGGCARWVGKPGTFYEAQGPPQSGPYRASRLQCTPAYWDWSTEPNGGQVAVVGAEIIPSSEYSVQAFGASCGGMEASCVNVSAPMTIYTRRKGDLDGPYQSPSPAPLTQADVLDVSQLVSAAKHQSGAPEHYRAQMQPNLPELNADVNVLDIIEAVDSVKRIPYSFSGPCPCPSPVTCGSTACASSDDCAGGMCVESCVGGDNFGEPCINDAHCPGGTCGTGFCRDKCGRCTP